MTSSSPTTTASKAPTSFQNLPVELKTDILSYLPFTEVRNCRRVCKDFRDIVDEKSNAIVLYRPSQDRDRDRLNDAVANVLDLKGVSFFDTLVRWFKQRGLMLDIEMRHILLEALVGEWLMQQGVQSTELEMEVYTFMLVYWADALIAAHVRAHIDSRHEGFYHDPSSISDRLNQPPWPTVLPRLELTYGISARDLIQWGREMEQDSRRLAAPTRIPQPGYVLTPLKYFVPDTSLAHLIPDPELWDGRWRVREEHGISGSMERLAELFDLRALPESCRHFAFCVKTKRAYDIVEAAVGGADISEHDKAFVLEDMYLF
ncbi:hypothetical protein HII31_09509 [Pseudocercospora fuligena]|uniref:F-box domain-containing protein n=1 Tax=Pseudocercospora fuligena TaxID=685502 RepID=A0A8H6VFZ8_9PEZI|nr:hypothetical protein HII31_09509 [Pseudocercospora fuligena]